MSANALSAPSTKHLPPYNPCFPGIFPVTHGRRLQPTTSPTRAKSTCTSAIYSANTPSSTKSHPSLPIPCPNACKSSSPSTDCLALSTPIMALLCIWQALQVLQHNYIDQITSTPHFPWSNGFIEWQVRTIKTMLSSTHESGKSLKELLLDLHSTPIGPNMPSLQEILHSRTFQHPRKPSTPVNMECACSFLLLRKHSQKQHFNCAHNARELQQLDPGQEVFIINKASAECIYIIEAQGKCYCRTPLSLQSKPHSPATSPSLTHKTKHFPSQNNPSLPYLKHHSHFPIAIDTGHNTLSLYPLLALYPPY